MLLIGAALLLSISSGCASSSRVDGPESVTRPVTPSGRTEYEAESVQPASEIEHRLRDEISGWEGTPYRYGGNDFNGVDCSAFVMLVCNQVLGVRLPRTTGEQVNVGKQILLHELQPGDLVFFHPKSKARHVGIFLSGNEFAHASTSQGVTISDLNDPYWQDSYWTARRVYEGPLYASSPKPDTPYESSPGYESDNRNRNVEEPEPGIDTRRVGW